MSNAEHEQEQHGREEKAPEHDRPPKPPHPGPHKPPKPPHHRPVG
jgi:hypothetical protein